MQTLEKRIFLTENAKMPLRKNHIESFQCIGVERGTSEITDTLPASAIPVYVNSEICLI